MIGSKFGLLTVVSRAENGKANLPRWNCVCDCGGKTISFQSGLRSGNSTSCGCKQKEHWSKQGKLKKTHGLSKTKEYEAWRHMKSRCYSQSYYLFKEYGGRGITVCEKWLNSFDSFISDVGMAPSKNHSIDRIDTDGNYEPSNVRWADWKTQQRNRRNNRLVDISGESKTLAEWCEIYDIDYQKAWSRISKLGMTPLFALTTKYIKRGPNNGRV